MHFMTAFLYNSGSEYVQKGMLMELPPKPPSRFEDTYKGIEQFKDYELTQCIAYEMAKRNSKVQEMIKEVTRLCIFKPEEISREWADKFNNVTSEKEMNQLLMEFIQAEPDRQERLDASTALDKKMKELSFFSFPPQIGVELDEMITNPYFRKSLNIGSQLSMAENSPSIDAKSIKDMFNDDGTVKTVTGAVIEYTKLFPPFHRQQPTIPPSTSKELYLRLNLALPEEDLTAFIRELKKAYEKGKGEVFRVPTPLDMAVGIDREIYTIQIKMKKRGAKVNLDMPEKTRQEVYADLLFLYDVFQSEAFQKKGERLLHFKNEMIDYYAAKVAKYHGIKDIDEVSEFIATPNDQTIRQLLGVMRSYIDDFVYKKLLV